VKIGPLLVAAGLLGFLAWRWRRIAWENRIAGLVVGAALAVYGTGLVHLPNLEELIRDIGEALGPYTYILVGVMAFLETGAFVGLIAPGETVVIVGGFVAGQGHIDIVILIGLVWVCAVAGDSASFLLGRRLGRDFLIRHGRRVHITEERLAQVEGFLAKHGGPTILIGRFLGLVRALAPFVAGASRMRFSRFFPYDVVAAGVWATVFSLLGYIFWRSFDTVVTVAKRGVFGFAVTVGLIVAGVAVYRYLRVPENRARARGWIEDQPVLGPLYRRVATPIARRVAPAVRFAWQRVTPGRLGLELTTLLAVGLVGGFMFGGLASLVSRHEVLRTDTRAFDVADDARGDLLTDVAKTVTDLGGAGIVGAVVLVAVGYLLARRRVLEGVTLAAGSVLTFVAVHIAKDAVDRARPSGALVDTAGSSFPSGHAAYAVAYVAVAIAIAHAFPRFVYRAAVVTAAIVVAAAVGLSRVYLHAHYLSDAVAGWGLAAAVFSGCGIVALIVAFLRDNARRLEQAG
jgi:membrane protein DedA with SNARE-associated domain/membrane-associated phospholipid phosphatase